MNIRGIVPIIHNDNKENKFLNSTYVVEPSKKYKKFVDDKDKINNIGNKIAVKKHTFNQFKP